MTRTEVLSTVQKLFSGSNLQGSRFTLNSQAFNQTVSRDEEEMSPIRGQHEKFRSRSRERMRYAMTGFAMRLAIDG